jgi:5'-deoxynucleotidase YfbR-like HD superfamily hydrolase
MIAKWSKLPWLRLAAIFRYSTLPTIHRESVAEHTCFVVLNSYAICVDLIRRGYDVDMGATLRCAAVHDIDEALTGDFIRTFKYSDPSLTSAIKNGTRKLMATLELDPMLLRDWEDAKADTLEGHVVELADLWSLTQFASREVRLGSSYGRELLHRGEAVIRNRKWHPALTPYVEEIRRLASIEGGLSA